MMAGLKGRGAIERDPDFAVIVLPNQHLERQVDGDGGRGEHQRSSRFRIAEDQELRGPHLHSDFFRFTTVIDQGEEFDSLGLENFFELLDGLIDRVVTGHADDSVV